MTDLYTRSDIADAEIARLRAEIERMREVDWRQMFLDVRERMRRAGESNEMGARWLSEAARAALKESDQ